MNNYDEIAKEAVNKVLKKTSLHTLETLLYKCAYEAARLQAERFNKDLDDSYIEYLSKEELC
jgi:hypothetical protein